MWATRSDSRLIEIDTFVCLCTELTLFISGTGAVDDISKSGG